ncbi:hypothetical protein CJU89_0350 [Yarrowia sp. B02]|nr:hypothetical protein CJU89_0350 [Yarrowia sp. B02]
MNNDSSAGIHGRSRDSRRARAPSNEQAGESSQEGSQTPESPESEESFGQRYSSGLESSGSEIESDKRKKPKTPKRKNDATESNNAKKQKTAPVSLVRFKTTGEVDYIRTPRAALPGWRSQARLRQLHPLQMLQRPEPLRSGKWWGWTMKHAGSKGKKEMWPVYSIRKREGGKSYTPEEQREIVEDVCDTPVLLYAVDAPRVVQERANALKHIEPRQNYFLSHKVLQEMDVTASEWARHARKANQVGPFLPNVYSCALGQHSYDSPPSSWTPYAADDFYADVLDKTGLMRDSENNLTRGFGLPTIPTPERSKALPQTDLLEQIHRYVSGWAHQNYPLMMNRLDESVLLAMGVVVEEAVREMLGKDGDLFYAVKEGAAEVPHLEVSDTE